MPTCQDTHEYCAKATWGEYGTQLFWVPLFCQAVLAIVMPAIALFFQKVAGLRGSEARIAEMKTMIFVIALVEGTFSIACAGLWVNRTYRHEVTAASKAIEMALCLFFIFNYFFSAARDGWPLHYCWRTAAIFDVITISSVFAIPDHAKTAWIGWGHLRIFRALLAYDVVEELVGLGNLRDTTKAVMRSVLRLAAAVTALGGTVMMLEVLGDPSFIVEREKFVSTDMGDLSVIQMMYWIFTTISTVGYGDFSPTTVLSRLFIIFAIVSGIVFFSKELQQITHLRALEQSGRGRYSPPINGIKAIVVLGGGVRRYSSMLIAFLTEVFDQSYLEAGLPACCLMAKEEEQPDFFQSFVANMPPHAKTRTKYFIGDPMQPADLERLNIAKAELVMVIPSRAVEDIDKEDESNLLLALAVKRAYPEKRLLLATVRPHNMMKALKVGIKASRCVSLDHLKSCLFSQSCLCRGWITFITNLLTSCNETKSDAWYADYCHGYNMEVYGLCLNSSFRGQTFSNLIEKFAGLGMMPIAVLIDGAIVVNPFWHTFTEKDVVFVLAENANQVRDLSDPQSDWIEVYHSARDSAVAAGIQRSQSKIFKAREEEDAIMKRVSMKQVGEEDTKAYNANAETILAQGGHYLLILLGGDCWEEVEDFITLLRSDKLPFKMPVLVLTPSPGPDPVTARRIFGKDPTCSFIIGSVTRAKDLRRAGIFKARTIVLLADNLGSKDYRMVDGSAVIALTSIESILAERMIEQSKVRSEQQQAPVPILCELVNPDSMKLLTCVPKWEVEHDAKGTLSRSGTALIEWRPPGVDEDSQHCPLHLHPRFAGGGIFNANVLGALLAQRYYKPGVIELMTALIDNHDQRCMPWQIKLKEEFVGRKYLDLVTQYTKAPWNACCVGLYRQIEGCWSLPYMFTNPPGDTTLLREDLVIVLGSAEFGKLCFDENLLAATHPVYFRQRQVQPANQQGHNPWTQAAFVEAVDRPLLSDG